MQLLLLLPVMLAACFAARNFAGDGCDLRGWRFFEPVSWIIPPGLATLLLYGLIDLNLFPATNCIRLPPGSLPLSHSLRAGGGALGVHHCRNGGGAEARARVDVAPASFA